LKGGTTYWAKFETPEVGFQYVIRQINIYASRNLTLEEAINKYAPSSDGNNVDKYLKFLLKNQPTITKKSLLTDINPYNLSKLIVRLESSTEVKTKVEDTVEKNEITTTQTSKVTKVIKESKFHFKLNEDQLDFFMKRNQFNLLNHDS